jgi:Fe-S oxidoreductase
VFRDELRQMLPDDEDAKRLAEQSFTLAELLDRHAPHFEVPRRAARALVQRHCHHYAVMGFDADRRRLERTGLDVEVLDSGCCGMAGSFGFEAGDHYDVSVKEGERALLPRIRQAPAGAVLVADGFSCRAQIQQGSERRALHLAEVLRLAMHADEVGLDGDRRPEAINDELDRRAAGPRPAAPRRRRALAVAGAGVAVAGAYRWWTRRP